MPLSDDIDREKLAVSALAILSLGLGVADPPPLPEALYILIGDRVWL